MTLAITSTYAALLGLLFVALRTLVTIERAKSGISILTKDNMQLAEKVRRFGNFVETAPLALILMGSIEIGGGNPILLHTIGALLLVSRIVHPFGLNHKRGAHPLRIMSGMMTLAAFLIASVFILWQNFS